MSTQEAKINKLQQSIDEIRIDLKAFAKKDDLKAFATKDDLKDLEFNIRYDMKMEFQKYATKDDIIEFKDEILTAIDAIAMRHNTFDQELLMSRSQYLRHEDRLQVIENKLDI